MKSTIASAAALACIAVRTVSASIANVYLIDPNTARQPRGTLSPSEARLVLAQRAGVEDYHQDLSLTTSEIDAINNYGAHTSLLEERRRETRRAMIFVADATNKDLHEYQMDRFPSFAISPAPGAAHSQGLFLDLATQVDPKKYQGQSDDEKIEALQDCNTINKRGDLFCQVPDVNSLSAMMDTLLQMDKYTMTALVTSADSTVESVVSHFTNPWGTYEMPNAESLLQKRERIQKEAPLELEPESTSATLPVESFSAPVSSLADSAAAVSGILPQCFSSQSACESTTRNCSGHGQCYKKYTDFTADSKSPYKNCYTCGCSATVEKDSDGKVSTTYWGGSGCQKKDVSTAFWLIALFVVGMFFLVGFAIGEVWGMGNEELPSVIGAGVSGPVKR